MGKILITGANRGIGLELCREMRAHGDEVFAACRRVSDELQALGVTVHAGVDVTDEAAVRGLAERLRGVRLDILVNNAGILSKESLDDLDFERIRRQFEVNVLGPLRVTTALLPNLSEGSKIVIVTSRMGSIGDNASGGYYGYRLSKAAVNMLGMNLANDLRGRGIIVAILHPGMVATELTGRRGISPHEAARGLIARIDEMTLARSGRFCHANGEPLPW